jgi:hypothetical protein
MVLRTFQLPLELDEWLWALGQKEEKTKNQKFLELIIKGLEIKDGSVPEWVKKPVDLAIEESQGQLVDQKEQKQKEDDEVILRTLNLDEELDDLLRRLAFNANTSKGEVMRDLIVWSLIKKNKIPKKLLNADWVKKVTRKNKRYSKHKK